LAPLRSMRTARISLAFGLAAALGLGACEDPRTTTNTAPPPSSSERQPVSGTDQRTTDEKLKDAAGRAKDKIDAAGDKLGQGVKYLGHSSDNAAADTKRDIKKDDTNK